jgi:hypothetical protein
VLALAKLGSHGDVEALERAQEIADTLIALQRRDGGWPWLFDAHRQCVVEPYAIYSVHQDAMAPMALLELYEATGNQGYRRAATRGLDWIYGRNDLDQPLLNEDAGIVYRSIRRRTPWDHGMRYLNVTTACLRAPLGARWKHKLLINPTDRPYHLGWVLEAWCGREQLACE